MDARRALLTTNGMVCLRPFVVFAIKMMAPGRRRVEMVRLAHHMNGYRSDLQPSQEAVRLAVDRQPQPVVAAGQRAA